MFNNFFKTAPPLLIGIGLILWGWNSTTESTLPNFSLTNTNSSTRPPSEHCSVVSGSIYDGDTLRINCGQGEEKIRFCGIDAPEKKQPGGIESRDYLRSLVARSNGKIYVDRVEQDRYGRTVAELTVPTSDGEIFLNGWMVLNGHAWPYKQYWGNCPNKGAIATAERLAKERGDFITGQPPWEWRKQN